MTQHEAALSPYIFQEKAFHVSEIVSESADKNHSLLLQIFTPEEMSSIEARADGIDTDAREGFLPEQCFHNSQNRTGALKRTKFFFGARCENLKFEPPCQCIFLK